MIKLVAVVLFDLLEATEGEQIVVLHEVHEATGGGDEDVASHLELLVLALGGSTTIDDARTQHGAVAQTTSLVEDLKTLEYEVNTCLTSNSYIGVLPGRRARE